MALDVPIYAGSASFFPGDTSFGYFDYDADFQCDAEKVANYCARRLGYPIMDVELSVFQLFDAFEAAVIEYSNQVNTYSARDNILNLLGFSTGSNLTQKFIRPTLRGIIKLSSQYGSEVGAGGDLTWYSGSISIKRGRQVYDIVKESNVEFGDISSGSFTIRRIYHYTPPASVRYADSTFGIGANIENITNEFGWSGVGTPASFTLVPVNYDVLLMQSIEFNDYIRRSNYSFQLTNHRLRIFPIPTDDFTLWFSYTLDDESSPSSNTFDGSGKISDHSNIPYDLIPYKYINQIGRQWIRKYALALAKEMLGYVRGKFSTIPVPDSDTSMNGSDLISDARTEQETLIEDLKEILDQMSRQSQLERKQSEADLLSKQLLKIPLKIYVR